MLEDKSFRQMDFKVHILADFCVQCGSDVTSQKVQNPVGLITLSVTKARTVAHQHWN